MKRPTKAQLRDYYHLLLEEMIEECHRRHKPFPFEMIKLIRLWMKLNDLPCPLPSNFDLEDDE